MSSSLSVRLALLAVAVVGSAGCYSHREPREVVVEERPRYYPPPPREVVVVPPPRERVVVPGPYYRR